MRFLIDENVPASVAALLRDRNHDVIQSREVLMPGAKDEILAATADREQAIVVTWNAKDFKRITARRAPRGTRARLRNLGWICFRCKEPRGRDRLMATIELIEFEHVRSESLRDGRIFVEIHENFVKIIR